MAALPARAEAELSGIQNDFLAGMVNLGIIRQLGLMIGLAASIAVGFGAVLWLQEEEFRPLYTNLDQMNPADVLNVLQSSQINHKVDQNTGALMVAANQIHDARLKLAGAGISPDGSFGFEMLDKEQPLGTSQFMENARFKRGLEGELARTIASIRSVRSARVHLAIPKTSAFIRDARKPTASVFVEVYSGSGITKEQVRAIANLVASSIPQLALQDVTVVDQRGNLLSNFDADQNMAMAHKHLDYVSQVEMSLVKRISSILEPVLGADGFRAEVSADLDFTQVEQTDELFNPDLPSIRSEQTVEESRGSGSSAGGVPGALSNQPPAEGEAPEVLAEGQASSSAISAGDGSGTTRRQAVRNYELDRTISHTRHQVGRLQRLSVAVLVDNIITVDADTGEISSVAIEPVELDRLGILVRDAVGFDAARGDSVNIINKAFKLKVEEDILPIEEPDWWENPMMMSYARILGIFLIIAILYFVVLRPVMRSLADNAKQLREIDAQRTLGELSGNMEGDLNDETVTLSGGDNLMLSGPHSTHQQQVSAIKGLIADDPNRVAEVVKKWVGADE